VSDKLIRQYFYISWNCYWYCYIDLCSSCENWVLLRVIFGALLFIANGKLCTLY